MVSQDETQATLTVADAARELGVTEDVVLQLIATRELAADIRIARSEFDRLVAQYRKSGVVNEYVRTEAPRTD
jgi:hypothetical protein